MTGELFAKLFFDEARNNFADFTAQNNIQCTNGKNISQEVLRNLYDAENTKCLLLDSKKLEEYKIATCCQITFKYIAQIILNKEQ